jgi:hypothetical protein
MGSWRTTTLDRSWILKLSLSITNRPRTERSACRATNRPLPHALEPKVAMDGGPSSDADLRSAGVRSSKRPSEEVLHKPKGCPRNPAVSVASV